MAEHDDGLVGARLSRGLSGLTLYGAGWTRLDSPRRGDEVGAGGGLLAVKLEPQDAGSCHPSGRSFAGLVVTTASFVLILRYRRQRQRERIEGSISQSEKSYARSDWRERHLHDPSNICHTSMCSGVPLRQRLGGGILMFKMSGDASRCQVGNRRSSISHSRLW